MTVAVFGSTGYIGTKVTEEMISRGFNVVAVAREQSGIGGKQGRADVEAMFPEATVKLSDVTDVDKLKRDVFDTPVDVVVCCLASRTGGIKDSWMVDYQVHLPQHSTARGGNNRPTSCSAHAGQGKRCKTACFVHLSPASATVISHCCSGDLYRMQVSVMTRQFADARVHLDQKLSPCRTENLCGHLWSGRKASFVMEQGSTICAFCVS